MRELQALLATVGAERPVLVLVDDLQWADTASLQWLNRLVARVAELPVSFVGTTLHGDPGGRTATGARPGRRPRVPLRARPLGPAAVRGVVAGRFGRARRPGVPAGVRGGVGGGCLYGFVKRRRVLDRGC
ncbi:hypothetical protein [Pseudonocardia sp. ICBG1293]|uniref:hypothetical protein n=1 Tax=Pseudonocardia sp. ICBG1293 TaxID=2844382 RepID=UPI001CCEC7C1|nr:hypothetical protein [Pseudonocardia sp. ICBG1293]